MSLAVVMGSVIVLAATAYDCWLSVKTRLRPEDELDPLARWVLRRAGLAGLVVLKALGAAVAVAVLIGLGQWWPEGAAGGGGGGGAAMGWVAGYLRGGQ